MDNIAGKYEYNIIEDIIAGRVNEAKKKLDEKIYKEYQDINNPKKPDEFGTREPDFNIEDEGGELADDEVCCLRNIQTSTCRFDARDKNIWYDFKLVADPITAVHGAKSSKQYGVPIGTKYKRVL